MDVDRDVHWEGCFNARDLGGLRTRDGRTTQRGVVVRSDAPDHMTAAGWDALISHGIRSIVDLRNPDELPADVQQPTGVKTVHVPLDDANDARFWQSILSHELDGSPLYYRRFLDQKSERVVAALRAVASADPGVLIHCVGGRDRTGLVTLVILALSGVSSEDIVADYEVSTERLRAFYRSRGEADQGVEIEKLLERKKTSARKEILDLLGSLDVEEYLMRAGMSRPELDVLRHRLVS